LQQKRRFASLFSFLGGGAKKKVAAFERKITATRRRR